MGITGEVKIITTCLRDSHNVKWDVVKPIQKEPNAVYRACKESTHNDPFGESAQSTQPIAVTDLVTFMKEEIKRTQEHGI
jgi:hypothetical protein